MVACIPPYNTSITPLALALACSPPVVVPPEGPLNLVIVAMDNVRYDHTSLSGYARDTTPNLAALAARPGAVQLTRAYAPASFSLPSYTSAFTGLHAARHQIGFIAQELGPDATTLAEIASLYGYRTAGFTGGVHVSEGTGLAQGFDVWQDTGWDLGPIGPQVDAALEWLDGRRDQEREAPYLLFVHGYDAHAPYPSPAGACELMDPGYDGPLHDLERLFTVRGIQGIAGDQWWGAQDNMTLPELPEGWASAGAPLEIPATTFRGREPYSQHDPARGRSVPLSTRDLDHLIAHYDASVAEADRQLGRLVEALEARGELARTVLVALSDHGELLGEYGYFRHDVDADEAAFRVPFVALLPDTVPAGAWRARPARAVTATRSLVDLTPTLSDLLGMVPPADVDGVSRVAEWLSAPPAGSASPEGAQPGGAAPPADAPAVMASTCCYAVRSDGWYLLRQNGPAGEGWMLFEDARGPDVADAHPEVARALKAHVSDWPQDLYEVVAPSPPPDQALRDRLRDAGYWTPGAGDVGGPRAAPSPRSSGGPTGGGPTGEGPPPARPADARGAPVQ